MKCPECVKTAQTSKVYSGGSSTTLLGFAPFYDEQGRYHSHDPNTKTTYHTCSNGHSWTETSKSKCWCQE